MRSSGRLVLFGSEGQLGSDIVAVFGQQKRFDVVPLRHSDADCTDGAKVCQVIVGLRPDIVINAAAYVRVDDCEIHASKAFDVNAIGALNIARACAEVNALGVYISTDYVFDGAKPMPYIESDVTCPVNVYGASKLAGELLIRQTLKRSLIVRTASLFGTVGARGKGGNFIETVLSKAKAKEPLRIVNDVTMSPTYTLDLATALITFIDRQVEGIFHVTNSGACTWYEFAKRVLDLAGVEASIAPISSDQYPTRARRPKNSVLQTEFSIAELPSWDHAVAEYLARRSVRQQ